MRLITPAPFMVYTLAELKTATPSGYEAALETIRTEISTVDDGSYKELTDSLQMFCEAAAVKIVDYAVSPSFYSYIRVDLDEYNDVAGTEAVRYMENVYKAYRLGDGRIRPNPFSGTDYDEVLMESVSNDIVRGETLKDSFENLTETIVMVMEDEESYRLQEECILDVYAHSGVEFRIEGVAITQGGVVEW